MSTCEKRYLDVWIYVCIYESNVNGSTTDAIDAKTINWKKNRTPKKLEPYQPGPKRFQRFVLFYFFGGFDFFSSKLFSRRLRQWYYHSHLIHIYIHKSTH